MKREYLTYKMLIDCGLIEKHNDLQSISIETPGRDKGYVYVLCAYLPEYGVPIKKIGTTKNPITRYKTITKPCPYPVFMDFLFKTPFSGEIEKELHNKFKANRISNKYCPSGCNEWFVDVSDLSIVTEFLNADYNKKKRTGKADVYLRDYSFDFSICSPSLLGIDRDLKKTIGSIKIEQKNSKLDLLLNSVPRIYSK